MLSGEIRNGISQTNKTTRANTDTPLDPNSFSKANLFQKIAIAELGGFDSIKDFPEYREMAPQCAMAKNIQELRGIMSRHHIAHKGVPIEDRVLMLLIYRDQQMRET